MRYDRIAVAEFREAAWAEGRALTMNDARLLWGGARDKEQALEAMRRRPKNKVDEVFKGSITEAGEVKQRLQASGVLADIWGADYLDHDSDDYRVHVPSFSAPWAKSLLREWGFR